MIKALLLVSSIIGGVGFNASPSLNEKAQKEVDTQYIKQMDNTSSTSEQSYPSYSLDIQPDFKKVIHTQWDLVDDDTNWDYYGSQLIQKNQSLTNNSVWTVNASKYTQNTIYRKERKTNTSEGYGFFYDLVNHANDTNWFSDNSGIDLYALQLDQVNTPITNNINLQIQNTSGMDFWSDFTASGNLEVYLMTRVNIINTSDNYAKKYIDASINSNININSWYNDIVDHVTNYDISTIYDNKKIADYNYQTKVTTNYQPISNIAKELQLELGTANYVFIKVVRSLRIYYAGTENMIPSQIIQNNIWNFQLYDTWGSRDGTYFNYYYSHNNKITLSGYYEPGTAMEVIDLPGLIFTIIGLPFTFLSTAFNLTLFPNTPYSINISSFIWTILGIVLLLAIIRLILRIFK